MDTRIIYSTLRLTPVLLLFAAVGCAPVEPAQEQQESQAATAPT
jgi:hypothetical protein